MAQLGQLPAIGDVVRGLVSLAGEDDAEPVTLELRVTELDRRRASSIVVRRIESKLTPQPASR